MVTKYDLISGLAQATAQEVVKNEMEWAKYLETAARIYRYPFKDQLLIYAQRPDATACASLEFWNEKMNCWVNKGAKGIALIDESYDRGNRLKYVFDVSDVHKARRIGKDPNLWKMKEEHKEDVLKRLENIYGETDPEKSFEQRIAELSDHIALDYYGELLPDLQYMVEGSFLEGYDEQNLDIRLRETLSASIAFSVLSRCGYETRDILDEVSFNYIHEFNSPDVLNILGNATSDLTSPILQEIGKEIAAYEKSHENIRVPEKGLANSPERDYNALKRESKNGHEEYIDNAPKGVERGDSDEYSIREERGLHDPDITGGSTAGGNSNQVRNDEGELSEGLSQGSLFSVSDEREIERASLDYPDAGRGEIREPDESNGENGRDNGELEGIQSDVMGTENGEHQSISGGDRTERAGLQPVEDNLLRAKNAPEPKYEQLSLFPSFEEQVGNIVAAEASMKYTMPAAFSLPKEHLDTILRSGGGNENSRKRIFAKYSEHKTSEEMIGFLKAEYGTTGKGFEFDGNPVSVWFDDRGMGVGYGTSAKDAPIMVMDWPEIEQNIRTLVETGEYMSRPEAFLVDSFEQKRVANQLYFFFRDGIGETPDSIGIKGNNFPDSEARLMELLSTHEGRNIIADELLDAKMRLDSGELSLRWKYVKSPEHLMDEVADLDTERLVFPLKESLDVRTESFITQDEIDFALTRGSGFSQGAFRIYEHFSEGHDKKDNVEFLKHEYGIGGGSGGLPGSDVSHNDHDGKGIKLAKGSYGSPYASVLLNWNVVEKRIRELVQEDKYLSPQAKEAYEQYKLDKAQKELERQAQREPRLSVVETSDAFAWGENYAIWDKEKQDYCKSIDGTVYTFETEEDAKALLPQVEREIAAQDKAVESYNHPEVVDITDIEELIDGDVVALDNGYVVDILSDQNISKEQELIGYDSSDGEEIRFSADDIEEIRRDGVLIAQVPEEEEVVIDDKGNHAANEEAKESKAVEAEELTFPWEENEPKEEAKKPEPDRSKGINYNIINRHLGEGTPKEKFRRNVNAIKLLNQIESEGRIANPAEQETLAQYVGWGGLADAFDETKSNWASEYAELKALLTPEEYKMARESTLNAHYTSPTVIRSMYHALENMGFSKGNVLEPSMGIGNFFGMMPPTMEHSRLYGVELDDITGRIAKQLYPQADVQIKGFEKTDYPNDFFDVAIGNVPFGQYKVADKQYDKNNFLIHDYFFAKALDKVRPGGVVAFITSKGTMDKASPEVRKYLAQRADLLGAVRLPNTAFKANAGTEVTSDILFFQKRDRLMDIQPDWVHLAENEDGITMNSYFADHPEQVVGKMAMVSGPFGMESTCQPDESRPFEEQLEEAIGRITGHIEEVELSDLEEEMQVETIPADPNVKNFSYTVVDNQVYYRENSVMRPVDVADTMAERIKGMVGIRNCTQELINMQLEEYSDSAIKGKQAELNQLYDDYSKKYGLINSQGNKRAFSQDSSYCLLCSLEKLDDEGNFKGKADMFTKRTIKKAEIVTSVDTASEALAVSLGEKAKVDLDYMSELTGKDKDVLTEELRGVIFQNPITDSWETADEYLSGNVREKLAIAETYAENHPEFAINVHALTQVQPKELDASEIEVRIGATWIDKKYIEDFMRDTFNTPEYLFRRDVMGIQFSPVTGEWNVKGKNADYGNSLVNMTYGTSRANAYKILEDSLNLKDTRIYDTIEEDGKEKRVLNKQETTIASQKQEAIREAFKDWIFRDPDRRQALVAKYNELFNSTRPREYDGAHLKFPGMTPDIELKPHQKNAVAHVLYGNNTLLAHCVGAGKTFEMTAAAMESKRLGLCQKSLFVVPNHLTEQWASDFLRLYPGANILAATKKDFEPANRKKFCSRIATGDYDAVIIGHSQFEKIPLSQERQITIIERQIEDITAAIDQMKADRGERYTIKQMEKTKKGLQTRLDKLNDQSRKDNVVTFEQLGVDRLFVDESHNYKNLFLYTKMRNVAGIAQTEAQKSSDMFAKCQYLDELTGGKGVTFATGTPISNSMTELYTNMRYLQFGTLNRLGLGQFDAWAASFGETQTAIELAPEGTGYRAKTRFAKFFNLPELISLFKEAADIQTPDMLKLPVPEAEYENVVLKPSEFQKEMVESLADRAEAVRDRRVDASVDNMLKITNDGRKLALDQRLMNPMLPDDENSKSAVCVEKAFEIWEQTKLEKSTQLIFCDLSTPKGDGTFNVYEDIRDKLVAKGVPADEIAFIHDANTETRKAELFAKVRSGQVRFLLGSTAKMGAGTNVQDKLIALHHLDVPWRPSDIEQQEGRILRQGNTNPKVKIFRYVTEGTFDSYSWQLIENKQKFIGQIMTSKSPVRSCEDVDEAALSYAEVKALATGNPYIKEKMDLDIQVSKLKLMKANHTSQRYRLEDNITQHYPQQIARLSERIEGFKADIAQYEVKKPADKEEFLMTVGGKEYTDRKEAGTALIAMCKELKGINASADVGEYLGFKMNVTFDSFNNKFVLNMKGAMSHPLEVGADPSGNITRINNTLEAMPAQLEEAQTKLVNVEQQLETAKVEVTKEFPQEAELAEKLDRLSALNALLNMDERGEESAEIDENAPKKEEQAEKTETVEVTEKVEDVTEPTNEAKETLAQAEPTYTIYQLKDNPELDDRRFEGTSSLMRMGILKDNYEEIKPENYQVMYSGKLSDIEGKTEGEQLEAIFEKFNIDRPEDFKGHSLSVSDIVVIQKDGETTAHFVDSFGFTGLPDFAKALENEPERVTEMAVKVGDFYVSIHESDEGLDYSIFDANYHLLDGGVITDPDITIQEALKQIIDDMGGGSTPPMAVDYERLSDVTGEVAQADMEAGVKALQDAERPDRALDEGSVSQPDIGIVSEETLEEQQPNITFVVAECSEFHNLGELHEGVVTMEEAIALWEDIPAERMNGIKSIGIECVDSSGETLDVDIVIGNKIDLVTLTYVPEIYENEQALDMIAQLIDHYPEMEVIGDIPEKIEQRLEALYEQNMDPADKLAAEIDAYMYDFNPYEYNDQVDDRKAQVDTISKDLQSGEAGYITSYLQEIVSQGAGTTEDQLKAQELISKIQEYKPLAKVEEIEEQNYNQIDNVLNNGFEQKKEEKEKEARGEDKSDKRPSLKKRLDEKKELVASEPERPALDKDKSKKKTEELS